MNRRLNDYLDKKGAEPLDEGVLKAYTTSMKERTIPEAKKQVRKNEERAQEERGTGCGVAVLTGSCFEASESCHGEERETGVRQNRVPVGASTRSPAMKVSCANGQRAHPPPAAPRAGTAHAGGSSWW